MTSAVTQSQVDETVGLYRKNASIWQLGRFSLPKLFRKDFGIVGNGAGYSPIIYLASVSKVLILLETALGLAQLDIESIPLTEEMVREVRKREPLRIAAKSALYTGEFIPVAEVFYQVAKMSSNSATAAIKELRQGQVGLEALKAAYLGLAASYQMTETTVQNHHWTEARPNTGRIHEIAYLLESMVLRLLSGQANVYELQILDSLLNNATNFGFCFTNSKMGQELIGRGYRIFEKTGYYPGQVWGKELALMGVPCCLTLATVATLVSPEGRVRTFWSSQETEIPIPWERIIEEGVTFPNDEGRAFKQYVGWIKPWLSRGFRKYTSENLEAGIYL